MFYIHIYGMLYSQSNTSNFVQPIAECKSLPLYFSTTGISIKSNFGFSVNVKNHIGLSLVQFANETIPYKVYYHHTWDSAGYLGGVSTDKRGNSYVIPRPFINTILNNPNDQNIVYKIDTRTEKLESYFRFYSPKKIVSGNPFGLMGIVYDCESENLFLSSIYNSTQDYEKGVIYSLNTSKGTPILIDSLMQVDSYGLGIAYQNNIKYLFFGSAKSSDIYRIEVSKDGKFIGQREFVLSIAGLGKRGDDKVRKIKFESNKMKISGSNFNFNLANVQSEIEYIYTYVYDVISSKWRFQKTELGIQ